MPRPSKFAAPAPTPVTTGAGEAERAIVEPGRPQSEWVEQFLAWTEPGAIGAGNDGIFVA